LGAKTALLAFADGDLPSALRDATPSSAAEAEQFVRWVFPGYEVELDDEDTLAEGTHPEDDGTNVTILAGAEILCDRRPARGDDPAGSPPSLCAIARLGTRLMR
jgi:hypothetical protein